MFILNGRTSTEARGFFPPFSPRFPMEPLIQQPGSVSSRRDFFKRAGLGAGVLASATALQACDSDDNDTDMVAGVTLDFSNDAGVLNYAYALEQLEYAFYIQVLQTEFTGMTAAERQVFTDLRAHEGIHAAFLERALGTNAIGALTPDFSAVNFSDRNSVLTTAITFEDLGVAAYNGAGRLLRSPENLTLAGKIVSVEARHASAIRDLILGLDRNGATIGEAQGALPEVVGANALDRAFTPNQVLAAADPFITNVITPRGL